MNTCLIILQVCNQQFIPNNLIWGPECNNVPILHYTERNTGIKVRVKHNHLVSYWNSYSHYSTSNTIYDSYIHPDIHIIQRHHSSRWPCTKTNTVRHSEVSNFLFTSSMRVVPYHWTLQSRFIRAFRFATDNDSLSCAPFRRLSQK